MHNTAGTLVQRKKLPKRNWFQRLMYNWYLQINYHLNVLPMRNSRFKYTLRLIIGITIWLFKLLWKFTVIAFKYFNFGISIKRGKTKASKTYLIEIKGFMITIAIKKLKEDTVK